MKITYFYNTQVVAIEATSADGVLSWLELEQLSNLKISENLIAKRLAAKRALFSCLAQISIEYSDYTAVSILHDSFGRPYFHLSESLEKIIKKMNVESILLSIADEKKMAYAYVVIGALSHF